MGFDKSILNLTLLQSLRSGNLLLDMCLAALLPLMLAAMWEHVVDLWTRLVSSLSTYILRGKVRFVTFEDDREMRRVVPFHRNDVLMYAMKQYIGSQKRHYRVAAVKLSSIKSTGKDEASDGGRPLSLVERQMRTRRLLYLPVQSEEVQLERGLWYRDVISHRGKDEDSERKEVAKKISSTRHAIELSVRRGNDGQAMAFLERAYEWYTHEVERLEGKTRYMHQPIAKPKLVAAGKRVDHFTFTRYELGSDKTFRSLFFPEKERVMKLLQAFTRREGKFRVKGFPHKLGLLLHGPPGTGKTSLVKAIAHHTSRHIVAIPLSRITTNQELLDVMLDGKYHFKKPQSDNDDDESGDDEQMSSLRYDQVVYLLEDVDAASTVVQSRGKLSTMTRAVSSALEKEAPVEHDAARATPATQEETQPDLHMRTMLHLLSMAQQKRGDGGQAAANPAAPAESALLPPLGPLWDEDMDKLNLSGLLAVLDGVIDTPGRILIMTTNHPERLDPALLRPGRVNLQLFMGFIRPTEACDMVRHYFPSARGEEIEDLRELLMDERCRALKLSAAELEQLCAEANHVCELVNLLRIRARLA